MGNLYVVLVPLYVMQLRCYMQLNVSIDYVCDQSLIARFSCDLNEFGRQRECLEEKENALFNSIIDRCILSPQVK